MAANGENVAANWRRCASCRKVLESAQYDGDADVCIACASAPGSRPVRRTGSPVRVSRVEPGIIRPVDRIGRGDREVRDRRARRAALERLAEHFPDEFDALLRQARTAEGLD